ncbi:hypothetical protein QFC22_000826 [Naganishia vaughanmartiniae]|uniref:Uncharacterized protein n=1 Tax=Naganishia vaughanmartiniae TaxID=1424756 RepID=A0ACC2XJK2_9TREE|nr:hypothetical protein QFC22_000826 [Naganishia vaughanmartiniae]
MDSDALFHVKQLFWQGSYKGKTHNAGPAAVAEVELGLTCDLGCTDCIAESTSVDISDQSDPESLSRALYAARSHLALQPPATSAAVSLLNTALSSNEPPASARAIQSFAGYLDASEDDKESKLDELRDLVLEYEGEEVDEETREEERIVRCMAGTAFILQIEVEEAVTTLTEGCGKTDLECTALLVQLLLSLDRRDLAQTTYQSAKQWGDDSLLIQIMEAWIGMKTGGRLLNQSYYLYEELYQLPSGRTPAVLASHAAAHFLLGHVEEAKADILEAQGTQSGKSDPAVLSVGTSLSMPHAYDQLTVVAPRHPLVADVQSKSAAFDEAAAKFSVTA